MNPFKNYQPTVNMDDVVRENKMSRTRTAQRAKQMASSDEQVRKAASGTIERLGRKAKEKR